MFRRYSAADPRSDQKWPELSFRILASDGGL